MGLTDFKQKPAPSAYGGDAAVVSWATFRSLDIETGAAPR
jgi:hypothetical protein